MNQVNHIFATELIMVLGVVCCLLLVPISHLEREYHVFGRAIGVREMGGRMGKHRYFFSLPTR